MRSMQNFTANREYQKTLKKSGHPVVSRFIKVNRWINRPLAWVVVKALTPTGITPNQVSVASFFIGVAGAACFAMGGTKWFLAAGILSQLSSIVDCADGMLARAKDMESVYGKYLDIFLDRIVEFLLIGGIALGLFRTTGRSWFLILGLLGTSVYFLHVTLYYITINYYHSRESGETSEMRALLLILILLFAVINRLDIGLWVLLVIAVITNIYIIVNFFRLPKKQPPLA